MKSKAIRVISLALLTAFVLGTCAIATADDTTQPAVTTAKEEVIYVNLNNQGQVESMYSVNSFDVQQAGTITDYGNFTNVTNLSNSNPIEYKDGKATVAVKEGKFYYQAQLNQPSLPWDIAITYTLNGESISAQELAGKEGALQMKISIKKNAETNSPFFENYALQASITLNTKKCSSIVAQGATIANAGANKVLTYTLLPGNEKDIIITANVKDFTMDGMQINALPFSIDLQLPDMSGFTQQITQLQDGIAQLNDGAGSMKEGLNSLKQGGNELYNGAQGLSGAVAQLAKGASDLANSGTQLADGSIALADGVDELAQGARQLASSLQQLDENSAGLVSGSNSIYQALEQINAQLAPLLGNGDNNSDIQKLIDGSVAFKDGLQQLIEMIKQMTQGNTAVEEAINALQEEAKANANLQILLQAYQSQQTGSILLISALEGLLNNYNEIHEGLVSISQAVSSLNSQLTQLAQGINQLTSQYSQFNNGLAQYSSGINQFYNGSSIFFKGIETLSSGAKDLQNGVASYTGGAQQLSSGLLQYQDGLNDFTSGIKDFSSGTNDIYNGAVQLANGTATLKNSTSNIDGLIEEEINNTIKEITKSDFTPSSFLSEKNEKINAVQFVVKTPGIGQPEEKEPPKQEEVKLSFWDKLLKLFGLYKEK